MIIYHKEGARFFAQALDHESSVNTEKAIKSGLGVESIMKIKPKSIAVMNDSEVLLMDNNIIQIRKTRNAISSFAKYLFWIFTTIFAIKLISTALFVIMIITPPEGATVIGCDSISAALALACETISELSVLALFVYILRLLWKNQSPFSPKVVKVFIAIGVLILIGAVASSFAPEHTIEVVDSQVKVGLISSHVGKNSIFINTSAIIESLVCFALASIFQYGTVLQKEIDDLA